MKSSLLIGLGLMLVFEGVFPFLTPQAWRETFERMLAMTDGQIRFVGLLSMLAGSMIIVLFH